VFREIGGPIEFIWDATLGDIDELRNVSSILRQL
jgi:hypothetical protein